MTVSADCTLGVKSTKLTDAGADPAPATPAGSGVELGRLFVSRGREAVACRYVCQVPHEYAWPRADTHVVSIACGGACKAEG